MLQYIDHIQCSHGDTFPLLPNIWKNKVDFPAHYLKAEPAAQLSGNRFEVGSLLLDESSKPTFMVTGHSYLTLTKTEDTTEKKYFSLSGHGISSPMLTALADMEASKISKKFKIFKNGWSLSVITLSDKGFCGEREDTAGPLIIDMVKKNLDLCICKNFMLSDDILSLRALITDLACHQFFNLIITTGGTGIGPRDITPQVTEKIMDQHLPGFMQAMMVASLEKTPNAIISRANAGIIASSIVINLPGSPKAVRENLAPLLPALNHALLKLNGDSSDCGIDQ